MEEKKINNISSVCVYCASSTKIPPIYFDAAKELGCLLGERKLRVVNGAGNIGLMCTVSDAALAAGGTVTGVIPHFMVEQDWYHKGLTELIEVETMHERKQLMANLSDAVIALPGGCGTLEELLEIITWKQLGLYLNPIVILNINHYYDPLLELLRNAMNENFMRPLARQDVGGSRHAGRSYPSHLRRAEMGRKPSEDRGDLNLKNEYDNEKT
mgnify:CR=1 FL=1